VRGRFHKLRLAETLPHLDLLHSPSQSIRAFTPVFAGYGVNALMASGEKENRCGEGATSSQTDTALVSGFH